LIEKIFLVKITKAASPFPGEAAYLQISDAQFSFLAQEGHFWETQNSPQSEQT